MIALVIAPVAAAACLQAPVASDSSELESSERDRHIVEVVRVLRTLRDPAHPPIESLVPAFVEVGQHVPDVLFDVLAEGVVPDAGAEGEGTQLLSLVQRDLILAAFGEMQPRAVRAAIGEPFAAPVEIGERVAAVHVLGALGKTDDLARVVELALVEPETQPARPMREAFRLAVASLLAREPGAFANLPRLLQGVPDPLIVDLVAAVGDTRDPRGLPFLVDVLAWKEDLFAPALAQIRKLGPSDDPRLNAELTFRLRGFLDPEEPRRSQPACLAVAALGDLESLPLLIELLANESNGLRNDAGWALRELTGMPFPPDQVRWEHWYRGETDWQQRERAKEFRRLFSRNEMDVIRALRSIARHPLARDGFVTAFETLISHRSAAVRAQACRTAAALRASVVPRLMDALEDPSPQVVAEAREAVLAITGGPLPDDADDAGDEGDADAGA